MTYKQALAKYKAGKYWMNVPPVHTYGWDNEAWVYWIFKIRPEKKEQNDSESSNLYKD